MKRILVLAFLVLTIPLTASAASITWTDWSAQETGIVTGTMGTINVTYTGQYAFAQIAGGINYWNPAAPYLSATVDNAPLAADIIAISASGQRTITFSSAVTNPIMAIVSLNSNSYVFGSPVTVLSYETGYWGSGTLTASGNVLNSTGEGHGAIQFLGTFDSISWDATNAENWNGFTVGFAPGASAVPEPASLLLLCTGLVGAARAWRKRKA